VRIEGGFAKCPSKRELETGAGRGVFASTPALLRRTFTGAP
jgi:hypothetical protein